jgi:hypothetical protein
MARRVLVTGHRLVCERGVLVGLVCGNRRGGAKAQYPEDPVAQKKRAHEQERELPPFGPAEEVQEPVLPPTTVTAPASYQYYPLKNSVSKAF